MPVYCPSLKEQLLLCDQEQCLSLRVGHSGLNVSLIVPVVRNGNWTVLLQYSSKKINLHLGMSSPSNREVHNDKRIFRRPGSSVLGNGFWATE